jgi:hypothetical protein
MRRYLFTILVGLGICSAAHAALAQDAGACPADARAAIAAACPCTGMKNHGQYVTCVRKQVSAMRRTGCEVKKLARCAAASICGRPQAPVVCCSRKGRPKLLAAERCVARGGTVMTGVTSLCDAVCPTPGT